jgi:hypothetical protein
VRQALRGQSFQKNVSSSVNEDATARFYRAFCMKRVFAADIRYYLGARGMPFHQSTVKAFMKRDAFRSACNGKNEALFLRGAIAFIRQN